ncbi:Uncharacterised protein [Neisseria animaloris]|nr:hypothetical protein BWD08_01110 [Neisseria animaloris]VEH87290.1 Uncharacterised protein [Neisseria animaloris]
MFRNTKGRLKTIFRRPLVKIAYADKPNHFIKHTEPYVSIQLINKYFAYTSDLFCILSFGILPFYVLEKQHFYILLS